MTWILLRQLDGAIDRSPKVIARLRCFYAAGAAVSLIITWLSTIGRLGSHLPTMANVFALGTAVNISIGLSVMCVAESTLRFKRLSLAIYDWILWASVVCCVQAFAGFLASQAFEFYYAAVGHRSINLGVVSALAALLSWIFLFWRTCLVQENLRRETDRLSNQIKLCSGA